MKKIILIPSLFVLIFCFGLSELSSQQKSITVLVRTSIYGAAEGFLSIINDTVPDSGEWQYKINPEVVKQFADANDIKINIKQDHKSLLMNDALYKIYQMQIISNDIVVQSGLSRKAYTDSVISRYNKVVNFYKEELGTQLSNTDIIQLQNLSNTSNNPNRIIYFYEKTTALPDPLYYTNEIEKQLDIINWFTIELHQRISYPDTYFIIYRINGGQIQ